MNEEELLEFRSALWAWSKENGVILNTREITIFLGGYNSALKAVREAIEIEKEKDLRKDN